MQDCGFDPRPSTRARVNQIKVVLDIESVTIFINGTKLTDFPGQSPETGGTFGVYGDSLEAEENEWRFTNFALFD